MPDDCNNSDQQLSSLLTEHQSPRWTYLLHAKCGEAQWPRRHVSVHVAGVAHKHLIQSTGLLCSETGVDRHGIENEL